ncbi:DUF4389 domain-containing protein [Streptomyces aidingensis]|uniref:DUF4389 domain-containing protein n=1 Tax=Streptomyces aidingensis TaxID=910347 RepID=A0A1I1H767_9ACTN|nr:DUF4389 domain-containing protein [Streptomyces aidingensis]SFC19847.1 protein of unknown function [Streptomyces aidingensis]
MAPAAKHPLDIEADIDPRLSRWMWLVKWLLAIPHYIVLVFLWIAFFFVTVVAFFAILFTARYPRALFDFNVGVLRWSWRVGYYAWYVLGTDRYPPFTLKDVPDYPLRVRLAYPERLSRGLVLVKWWLLALPQYLVVAVLTGAGGGGGDWDTGYRIGLVPLLTLFAVIALLFTARYPRGLFDFLVGLVRWTMRVDVYASLLTDTYPPFRLDMGGREPGAKTPPATPAAPGPPPG